MVSDSISKSSDPEEMSGDEEGNHPPRSVFNEDEGLGDLDGLPPEIVEIRREMLLFEATSGSMPPPTMLGRYNNVVPNGAERIMDMAESQQSHRTQLESRVVDSDIAIRNRALTLGFWVVMTAIIGGIVLATFGLELIGSTMIAGGLISSGLTYFKGLAAKEERMSRHNATAD